MFDPVTAALVQSAPKVRDLNPDELVDELTSAYVDIAAARLSIGLAQTGATGTLVALRERMSKLADTYEGQIILDINNDKRKSAAFVAGCARQVLSQIDRLGELSDEPTRLDEEAIGPEIASALLFLIAERSSDAFEAARDIRAAGIDSHIRRSLVLAIGRLARGNFNEILDLNPGVGRDAPSGEDDDVYATDLMYGQLLRGVITVAQVGLGILPIDAIENAQLLFSQVRRLSVDISDDLPGMSPYLTEGISRGAISVYAGPHHLAALLMKLGDGIRDGLLVRTPTPTGTSPHNWDTWLKTEAQRWPYLWENHRRAIATGYLDIGSSLVMTTPTGSGKTTLAALKIASTLGAGKTVLYLAPTHALVSQVERDLNDRMSVLATAKSIENVNIDETVQKLPDLAVVTPERCLALLTFAPELFSNVGLLVFDEFHLLGVSRPATAFTPARVDRRGIDAMLCLVTFMSVTPSADYLLLSAMVSNGQEIASWLVSLLHRPVLAFDDKWKPTRQLRACVVYDVVETSRLTRSLYPGMPAVPLAAIPYGLFSLVAGWHPNLPEKLAIRSFAPKAVPLKKGAGTWLTSNRYEVAATIASKLADAGLKVIIFCESIPMCVSTAKNIAKNTNKLSQVLGDEMASIREAIISELGAQSAIYDAGTNISAVHHGELLPNERIVVEGLFRSRESGLSVLAATSTLAQGLNLPCDVVILAGTDRLDDSDPEEKSRSPLMPHEILNALGRAGRAGQAATGLSIVIPGSPISGELDAKRFPQITDLPVVFAEGDQCLPLADPIATLLDQIEASGVSGDEAKYLIRRFANSFKDHEGVESFELIARRSFGYYKKALAGQTVAEDWMARRRTTLEAVLQSREQIVTLPWQEELAAKTGVSPAFILKLADSLESAPIHAVDAIEWVQWLLGLLDTQSEDFDALLRPETIIRVFGRAITSQRTDVARREKSREALISTFPLWLAGAPLVEIEDEIAKFIIANEGLVGRPTSADKKAKRARRLFIRLAPDVGFICGVLNQVFIKSAVDGSGVAPPMVTFLPQLVRHGFQTPYHFALSRLISNTSRPDTARNYDVLSPFISRSPTDDWDSIRSKLQAAQVSAAFDDIELDDFENVWPTKGTEEGTLS